MIPARRRPGVAGCSAATSEPVPPARFRMARPLLGLLLALAGCGQTDGLVGPPAFQIMGDLPTVVDKVTFDRYSDLLLVDARVSRGMMEAAVQGDVPFSFLIRVSLADQLGRSMTIAPPAFPLALFKPVSDAVEAVYAVTLSLPWDGTFDDGTMYTGGSLTAGYASRMVRELPNGREIMIGSETSGWTLVSVIGDE